MKEIVLNRVMVKSKNYKKYSAFVDDQDFEKVNKYNWSADDHGHTIYAITWINGKVVYMHNFVTGFKETDHIDRNGLNNCSSNLRQATRQQNMMNKTKQNGNYTSTFKGVFFRKNRNQWQAQIVCDNKKIYLGNFNSEVDAAKAYNIKANELHGDFAKTNKI